MFSTQSMKRIGQNNGPSFGIVIKKSRGIKKRVLNNAHNHTVNRGLNCLMMRFAEISYSDVHNAARKANSNHIIVVFAQTFYKKLITPDLGTYLNYYNPYSRQRSAIGPISWCGA